MAATKNDAENKKPNRSFAKEFIARNSLMTELYDENIYIRGIYNIVWAMLLAFYIHSISFDYLKNNRINLGLSLIKTGFPKPLLMMSIWFTIFASTFVPFYGLIAWMTIRKKFIKNLNLVRFCDEFATIMFAIYIFAYLYYATDLIVKNNFPFPTSGALLAETVRLLMKVYAFVRSSVPRALNTQFSPKVSQYLYFSFAPTLVYQDTYPRTPSIRWNYVAKCVLEFSATILIITKTTEVYLMRCEKFASQPYAFKDIILLILENVPIGFLFQLYGFYTLFHTWLNLFAELLRFADRLFYTDWWACTSYERYYRTWNVVVQDWLYIYIYKDFYEVIVPKNKTVARTALFFISAVFHEYVLAFALRFFYPLLFIQFFSCSMIVKFLKCKNDKLGNIIFLYTLAFGTATQFCGYALIYFSKFNNFDNHLFQFQNNSLNY